MKKRFFVILTMALVLVVFGGCGGNVSQERYQKLEEELAIVQAEKEALQIELEDIQNQFIVLWEFGTGIPRLSDYELFSPTTADEIDNGDAILVADLLNYRVIIIDRATKQTIWELYEIDIGQFLEPASAHMLPDGSIIIANGHGNNVLIIDRSTKSVLWEYPITHPRDAIQWDDNIIAISRCGWDKDDGVYWIDRTTMKEIKSYINPYSAPMGLTRLEPRMSTGEQGIAVLIGHDETFIEEVLYNDLSVIWQYGEKGTYPAEMNAWNRGMLTHWAIRIGMSAGTRNPYLTIISDNEGESVYAVNHNKERVWTLGGAVQRNRPLVYNLQLICPHGISLTKEGNLLIVDSHGNKVFEVDINIPPTQPDYIEAYPVYDFQTTDDWQLAGNMQVRGYETKYIQLWNMSETNSLEYHIHGVINPTYPGVINTSSPASVWKEEYQTLPPNSSVEYTNSLPFSLLSIYTKSSTDEHPANLRVWVSASNISENE